MLEAAQLCEEILQTKIVENWYKPENRFWNYNSGSYVVELPDDNHDEHHLVSRNDWGGVLGYISYKVDWEVMSCSGFAAISFDKGNLIFAKDLYKAICDIFNVYHMNRLEWTCYADNPALKGYRRFIEKHGGRECGYYKQNVKLQDGKLHDTVFFEIMADEFIPSTKGLRVSRDE